MTVSGFHLRCSSSNKCVNLFFYTTATKALTFYLNCDSDHKGRPVVLLSSRKKVLKNA